MLCSLRKDPHGKERAAHAPLLQSLGLYAPGDLLFQGAKGRFVEIEAESRLENSAMTPAERNYAALLLLWSRTISEHKMDFDSWIAKRNRLRSAA